MSVKARLFWSLWIAGFIGVLAFLFVDLAALINAVPLPADTPPPQLPPLLVLKFVSLIQPTVLLTLAVLAGVFLSSRLGLRSPAFEAYARRGNLWQELAPQIWPGVIAGLSGGILIIGCWIAAKPFLSEQFINRAQEFNQLLPAATRFLFGGFTEELLLRWGFMTLLVSLSRQLFQRSDGPPSNIYFIAAILFSAVVFGAGHLPLAMMLAGSLTAPLVGYVILANSIFGIIAGFLYWKRGLESAMIAHIFTHVVLVIAIYTTL